MSTRLTNRRAPSRTTEQTHGRARQQASHQAARRRSTRRLFLESLEDRRVMATFVQNFDAFTAPTLPTGFSTSTVAGAANLWATTAAFATSAPNSGATASPAAVSDNVLVSPIFAVSAASTLSFQNNFDLQDVAAGFDGGVLEISINGGAFNDFVTAGGSFSLGGYTAPLGGSNPLAGRQAWSGTSGGFITTIGSLPAAAIGQNAQLRWRLATDGSVASSGWRIDDLQLTDVTTTLTYNSGSDNVTVRLNGTNVELRDTITSALLASQTAAATSNILFNGSAAATTLTLDFSNGNPFTATSINVTGTENIVYTGTAANDLVTISTTGANAFTASFNGIFSAGWTGLTSFSFNGGGLNDNLSLAYNAGGSLPTINYDGGVGGLDTLTLGGPLAINTVTHNFTNANDGSVNLTGQGTINYLGLDPIVDNMNAVNRIFNFNGGAETITLGDDLVANDNVSRIQSTLGELVDFLTPTATMTINTGVGPDIVTLGLPDLQFNTPALTVNASTSADTINVTGSRAATTTTINAGDGLDNVNIGTVAVPLAPGLLTPVAGAVIVNGDALGANLLVDGSGAGVLANYQITNTTITRSVPAGFGGVTYNGLVAGNDVTLRTGAGQNAITIPSTLAGLDYFVLTGDQADTITLGPNLDNLDHATLSVDGQGAVGQNDTLNVDDSAGIFSDTFTVTSTTVTRPAGGFNGVTYSNIEVLNVLAGGGGDTVNVNSTLATTTTNLDGGAADDVFNIGTGNLDLIAGPVTVTGAAGGDQVNVNDQTQALADTFTVTSTTVTRTGGFGGLTYGTVEGLTINATGDDTFDVLSTAAATPVVINIVTGTTTTNVSNTSSALTVNGGTGDDTLNLNVTGHLENIAGPVVFNGNGGTDTANLSDFDHDNGGDTYTVTNTTVTRTFGFGGLTYGTLEALNLLASLGSDIINVNSTAAGAVTALDGNTGNDTFNVAASALASTNNILFGGDNDDTFNLNVGLFGITAPVQVLGQANDFGGGVGSRDVVVINEQAGFAVNGIITYTGGVGGSETLVDGLGSQVTIDTVETIDYNGNGFFNDDTLTVVGTAVDDLISVVPFDANRAIVFNGGNPFDGPPEDNFASLPGVSGGSAAPDLDLSGLDQTFGLFIADAGATTGDRLYVYGQSEAGLDDGNAADPFGFGAGLLMPALGAGNAYDFINSSQTQTTVNGFVAVNYNNADFVQALPNVDPAVVINSGFEGNPPPSVFTDPADQIQLALSPAYKFQVNGGDPDPATTAIVPPDGDALLVGGFFPTINVFSTKNPGGAPVVSFEFPGSGNLGFSYSSIENLGPFFTNTLNLIGDNNDPAVDQNDNFVIVGRDVDTQFGGDFDGVNEVSLVINGSLPIGFSGVTAVNAFGDDINPGVPSVGPNDIDTLEITPYADDTPRGWGIDVAFNEGNPAGADGNQADLIILHTSLFGGMVSENIVIKPSGLDNGEIIVTNASFGTPIVDIDYVANTDIIVRDDDGFLNDTDTLTLLGSNPNTPGLTGNETFDMDGDAAMTLLAPLVTVFETGTPANILYRLREYTVGANLLFQSSLTMNGLAGDDTFNLRGGATAQRDIQLNFLGGEGADDLNIDLDSGFTFDGTGIFFDGGNGGLDSLSVTNSAPLNNPVTTTQYTVGTAAGSGRLSYVDVIAEDMIVDFVNLEPVLDLVISANLIVNANNASNAINYSQGAVAANGLVSIDDHEVIEFSNKVLLTINALAGSDEISLNNPNTPTGLTGITVNGGNPTAGSDVAIISGLAGAADAINFAVTTDDDAVVTGAGPVPITLATVESAVIDGQGGTDTLTYTSPAGVDILDYAMGVVSSEGRITGVQNNAPFSTLMPLSFTNIFAAAGTPLTFANVGGARADTLYIHGSELDETFTVTPATGALTVRRTASSALEMLPTATPGVNQLILQGNDGDDTFNIPGNHPFASAFGLAPLVVEGGNPSAGSDVLNFTGAGAAITVNLPTTTITETGFGAVAYVGVEDVAINGGTAALTVNGTTADDRFDVQPTGAGTGSLKVVTTGSIVTTSPQFTYTGVNNAAFTLNGGATGFDDVHLLGTNGIDTITAAAATVTQAGGTVTFAAGGSLDRLSVDSLDGNDSITLTLFASAPALVRAGDGNDTVLGTTLADILYGSFGNDILVGGGGDDFLYGEDGNDIFGNATLAPNAVADDPGIDSAFGGEGFDNFVWEPGDGADFNNGGGDQADIFRFFGSAAANTFILRSGGTQTHFNALIGAVTIDNHGIEDVVVDGQGGGDTFTVEDLFATEVKSVNIVQGAGLDTVTVQGRDVTDTINLNNVATNANLTGLRYNVRVQGSALADADVLIVNGNDGNDNIVSNESLSTLYLAADLRINGGNGSDFLSGHGNLSGDAGDDTLTGGLQLQTINGGAGNDVLNGGGGLDMLNGDAGEDTFLVNFDGATDVITGGTEYDTVLIIGTSGNDVVAANQTAAGTIVSSLNGVNDTDSIATIERVRIEANSGDDIIFVQHLEGLGTDAPTNNSVLFDVDGGAAFTADRLVVQDNGASNVIIYRKAETATNGSVTVGPIVGAITESLYTVFTGVEYVDPLTGTPANIFVFKYDPFEWNGNFQNATHLGAGLTLNVDPVIDPGVPNVVLPPGFNNPPADEDFYRIEAQETGTLDVQVFFRHNVGLPGGGGDIDIQLLDVDGTVIASDLDVDDDARVRIPAVEGQIYFLRVFQGQAGALNTYSLTIINEAAPVPFALELDDSPVNGATNPPGQADNSDTGRSQDDNITYDNTPTIVFRVPDNELINDVPDNSPGQPGAPVDGTVIPINFQADTGDNALAAGFRVAVYRTENNTRVHVGYASSLGNGVYQFTFPAAIPDGSNFISARVEMVDPTSPEQNQGFGAFATDLEIFVDTVIPPVFFGQQSIATDGLHPNSDSGVLGPANVATLSDRITNDTTPTFWGRSEANANIRAYLDVNGNGAVDLATDIFLGFTTAIPYSGTNQMGNPGGNEPNGYWELTSVVNLDSQAVLTALGVPAGQTGGLRRILISAEDVAGNITSGAAQIQLLNIFVDEQGPQITGVEITGQPGFDIFDPKASNAGQSPTPLVNSLSVGVQDFPVRLIPGIAGLTDYAALQQSIAEIEAHYQVRGDFNGIIPIQMVTFIPNLPVNGAAATGTIVITFFSPLPDDRFTLTIQDDVVDPAGNRLDGESNASEPQENPTFPSGDGVPGGDFVARFTVDTRPELGTWAAGSTWIDTNGNSIFDQDNLDFTNRDIAYLLGYTSDELFAGNFANAGVADGFDKLAAYGRVGANWRWQIDTDNDGVPNIEVNDPARINGFPVSGDFAPGLAGDEVGLFTGNTWFLDNNGDFNLQNGVTVLPWRTQAGVSVSGYGFTGDFDGDGVTDLATWTDDTFQLDLSTLSPGFAPDGRIDSTFSFGFPGARERPVAADMNMDGFDDIGLWTPDRTTQTPGDDAEWYFLVSGLVANDTPGGGPAILGPGIADRVVADPITPGRNVVKFTPVPFGNDLYYQYGDEFSLPILGNFDPPLTLSTLLTSTNPRNSLDVNNDGRITAFDAIDVINRLNLVGGPSAAPRSGFLRAPFLDVDGSTFITAFDVIPIINYLNLNPITGGEAVEPELWSAGEEPIDEELLALLAAAQEENEEE